MKETSLYNVLTARQFDKSCLRELCILTDKIRQFNSSKPGLIFLQRLLAHKRAMLYFTQPSTRTFLSFQSACHILGMKSSEIRDSSISSERKGESTQDSLRTFSSYVDLIIMRSLLPGLCHDMSELLACTQRPVPIINAGSGADEHPTQALLDIYTLYRSFAKSGGISGKKICFVGDLKRGRTVRSLSRLLVHYENIHLIFVSPIEFQISSDLRDFLRTQKTTTFEETNHFLDAISQADAIYMTRVQDEHDKCTTGELNKVLYKQFHLRYEHLKKIKQNCIIMHPLPRKNELDIAIDGDPRAKYWRQERNGMWTRAAIICKIFGVDKDILEQSAFE